MNPKSGGRPLRSTRRMSNLQRASWYTIKNQAEDAKGPLQVYIFDEIGFWGVSASDFIGDLTHAGDGDVEMHINSPGGDIFDGIAIFNLLKSRSGLVSVVVDGLAASAASFIAQAASPNQLFMAPHSQMMIHDGFAMAIGNAADMRETAALLDKASDNIASIYAERSGRDQAYWRERMRDESWYDAQEAVDAGLADAVKGQVEGANNTWNLQIYNHFRPLSASNNHAPFSGVHTHMHPSYGAPQPGAKWLNADGTHSHEHSHDDDNDHHPGDNHQHGDGDWDDDDNASNSFHQLILNAAVDESPWDRDKAMHAAAESDSPAKAYAKICAGRREGPADEGQNWALPHHYPDKDAPNAAGVRSALGYLSSTKGLTNESAARAHLEKHMRAINPDWKPDSEDHFGFAVTEFQEALR